MNEKLKTPSRWFSIANRDLNAARKLQTEAPDISAYHIQQAAEKYLKGFLVLHGQPLKKPHDISALLLKCILIDDDFKSLALSGEPEQLTNYASKYRYPNEEEVDFPPPEDLCAAMIFCEKTQSIVLEKFEEMQKQEPEPDATERPPV